MTAWNWKDFKSTIQNITPHEMSLIDTLSELQVERQRQGISQSDFANQLGISLAELNAVETLDTMPDTGLLQKYAANLNYPFHLKQKPITTETK
ncbi:helix-turn-helix domain-containing protein [Lactiplantibacillus nangangensis]|uniref:Helix-turn-helix domain-containing protein n=1 Tax=Lactiplantibacillus nangangensis TaxID=2559917 RepID=A0ABW1SKW2_9LACO|nr:helix-turn-helix transcriptional regulator [Lactiplantibacillus nangangensis]